MKGARPYSSISRHRLLSTAAVLPTLPGLLFSTAARGQAPGGVLPSWNDGPAKQAIDGSEQNTYFKLSAGLRLSRAARAESQSGCRAICPDMGKLGARKEDLLLMGRRHGCTPRVASRSVTSQTDRRG